MKPETITSIAAELSEKYVGTRVLEEGRKLLIKLPTVVFPVGCTPPETAALVVLDTERPAPQLFVHQLPTLPNGKPPRSVSAVTFAGDTWQSFSFNQPWDENRHTAVQFVEGRLRRFALNE